MYILILYQLYKICIYICMHIHIHFHTNICIRRKKQGRHRFWLYIQERLRDSGYQLADEKEGGSEKVEAKRVIHGQVTQPAFRTFWKTRRRLNCERIGVSLETIGVRPPVPCGACNAHGNLRWARAASRAAHTSRRERDASPYRCLIVALFADPAPHGATWLTAIIIIV